jgi:hypothetical protein
VAIRATRHGDMGIMTAMPTDFRDGQTFPRPGRLKAGEALWLFRLADKARAAKAGTIYDYVYPCPMDRGILERWGVPITEFETALDEYVDDETLIQWFRTRVLPEGVQSANRWLLDEKAENLDRQDREEGVTASKDT